jgi:hypothetical protein
VQLVALVVDASDPTDVCDWADSVGPSFGPLAPCSDSFCVFRREIRQALSWSGHILAGFLCKTPVADARLQALDASRLDPLEPRELGTVRLLLPALFVMTRPLFLLPVVGFGSTLEFSWEEWRDLVRRVEHSIQWIEAHTPEDVTGVRCASASTRRTH